MHVLKGALVALALLPLQAGEGLPDSLEQLLDMNVITAGKTAERVRDVPASVVVLTRDEIETHGWRSLTEVLENLPGLFYIDDFSAEGPAFGVRGFWSGSSNYHMAILVNGVRQEVDCANAYSNNWFYLPVDAVDRIEVVRGPMSVFYGSGAIFGAINIITNQHGKSELSVATGDATRGSGERNRSRYYARYDRREGDWSYVLNIGQESLEGPDVPIQDLTHDPSPLRSYGIGTDYRTGDRLGSQRKNFQFTGNFGELSVDLTHVESHFRAMFLYPSVGGGESHEMQSTILAGTYRTTWSEHLRSEARITYLQTNEDVRYRYMDSSFYGVEDNGSSACELEALLFASPTPVLDLTFGLDQRTVLKAYNDYNLPSFNAPSLLNNAFYLVGGDSIVTRSFYTQATGQIAPFLKAIAGFRLEQTPSYRIGWDMAAGTPDAMHREGDYQAPGTEFLPRLALIASLSDVQVLKLMYGKAIQTPCFFQNTKSVFDTVHPSLQPERIQTFEGNYLYSTPRLSFGLNLFRNQLESLITRIATLDPGTHAYTSWNGNAGRMVTVGSEVTMAFKPMPAWDAQISVTLQNTKDLRPGYEHIAPAYSPRLLACGKLSWKYQNLSLALDGSYRGAMETYWDETKANGLGGYGARIGDRIGGLFILGGNLRWENLFDQGLALQLRVSDGLGRDVRYPTYTLNEWADKGTFNEGRAWMLGLSWKF